ncbi:ABC transporter substrate-binding protein [Roseomonas sp. 18066]|uniref:ABC transporter substrate-binding protein n=1 Tax=Roseomonas sp. 18066 TaxID=2681412 RepID=UPI00135BCDBA|nr:ABC transporter substrate-binding protein [Roseomonas sp. 18066]
MTLSRRHLLHAAGALTVLPGLASAQTPAAATPRRGGTLVVAQFPEPTILTGALTAAAATNNISPKLFDGLLTYDFDFTPKPQLATAWEIAEDGLSIAFTLRSGVRWHDGRPFTSADVAFSVIEVWKKYNSRQALFANVTAVDTPDAQTAILRLAAPSPYILYGLTSWIAQILPKHVYEGTDFFRNPANIAPIGTGPFRFLRWDRGSLIRLERNPDYWDQPKPYLDQIIYRFLPDAAGRAAALEAGDVHLVAETGVPGSDLARLKRNPELELTTRGYDYLGLTQFFQFNLDRPYFQDVRVRRAFAHAIDRDFIVRNIWYGYGEAAISPIPRSMGAFHSAEVPRYAFDPARARQLLDEAGLKPDGNGIRLSITHDHPTSGEQFLRTAEYIREALGKVGIRVTVRSQDFASFSRRVYTARDFDTTNAYTSPGPDPAIGTQRIYWSKAFQPGVPYSNGTHYNNPEVDRLLETAQVENDPAKRLRLYAEFQRLVQEDLPEIPLVSMQQVTVSSRRLRDHTTICDGIKGNFADAWLQGA